MNFTQTPWLKEPAHTEFTTVHTNLYELIEMINKDIEPDEDQLVPEIISDLFCKGLISLPHSMMKSIN
jgi:hypothetical protein